MYVSQLGKCTVVKLFRTVEAPIDKYRERR
jgi:hypothetical protein